jgi:aminoglycoside 2''-phosphotransferase
MKNMLLFVQRINECYPTLPVDEVYFNDSGENNDVLIINNDIIFRFPRHAEGIQNLLTEATLLTELQGRLPLDIPNPLYRAFEPSEPGQAFMGYPMIPGKPLFPDVLASFPFEKQIRAAHDLACFLRSLHLTPISGALNLKQQDHVEEWQRLFERFQAVLQPHMSPHAWKNVCCQFDEFFARTGNDFTPALRHGDFGPGNIMVDENRQIISGVIDFGSAGIGDPAVDIAGLVGPAGYGEDFVRQMLVDYPEAEGYLERAHFYASTFALQEALFGIEHDDQKAFESGIAAYR